MAQILTFIGQGGTAQAELAIAAAKHQASQGKRVLLASQEPGPALGLLLGAVLTADPVEVSPGVAAMQFQSTVLVQQAWEQLKQRETQYLRSPFFKNVYGEELGILPGMDAALALNTVRELAQSNAYDVIVYHGESSLGTLRNLGSLEVTSWYVRRFQQVILESEIGQTLLPFLQPISAAVLQNPWNSSEANAPLQEATDLLEEGRSALNDPARMLVYLVTTGDEAAIATARYLWGSAQQVGLTVGGVCLTQGTQASSVGEQFSPLALHSIPRYSGDWQLLVSAMPNPADGVKAPRPLDIDVAAKQMRVFLPGFDKKQVKLTQYNQEVTIEAGDQRRNIQLPAGLKGRSVTGAKFQDNYLIISF